MGNSLAKPAQIQSALGAEAERALASSQAEGLGARLWNGLLSTMPSLQNNSAVRNVFYTLSAISIPIVGYYFYPRVQESVQRARAVTASDDAEVQVNEMGSGQGDADRRHQKATQEFDTMDLRGRAKGQVNRMGTIPQQEGQSR